MEIISSSFLSNGHKIGTRIINNNKEKNILLLHGFNDTKETFLFQEKFLSEYFNIYSFDFRGHGDSDWKKDTVYSSVESLLDIHNFVTKFLPESFFLLGHSMGAGLASRYAGFYPEKILGLILFEGFSGLQGEDKDAERIKSWLETMSKKKLSPPVRKESSFEDLETKLGFIYNRLEKEKVKLLLPALIEETESGKFRWKNDPNLKTGSPIPFPSNLSRHLWKKISCPVLIFFGKETHLMPKHLEEILSHFANIEFNEIESAGHNFHHEKPDEINNKIKAFLNKNMFV